jgi:hypothetical protein
VSLVTLNDNAWMTTLLRGRKRRRKINVEEEDNKMSKQESNGIHLDFYTLPISEQIQRLTGNHNVESSLVQARLIYGAH